MTLMIIAVTFNINEGPLIVLRRATRATRSPSVAVLPGRLSFSRPGTRLTVTIMVVLRAKLSIIEREMKPINVLKCSRFSNYRKTFVSSASNRTSATQLRDVGMVRGSMSVQRMTETVVAGL